MKAYDEYKETGSDWLPFVPKHWQKVVLRSFTKLSEERNAERTDLELLSVYREYGVIKKSSRDDNHNVESADLSNYKVVNKGSLVINKMKLWQGSLGISKYAGIVSPAYIVCNLHCKDNLSFLNLLLRSALFKTYYNRISYGIRVGQWDSNYEDIKKLEIYLPPREEQDKIVKFLDHKLEKIQKFIANKQKLIILLEEQKQAIINQAVTKGLDLNTPMKDSGIDWLGQVPKHWEVRKLRALTKTRFQYGANESGIPYSDDLPRYIRITDIDMSGNLKNENMLSLSKDVAQPYILDEGDVLFARSGATVGKSFLFKEKYGKSCFAGYLIKFKADKEKMLPEFLYGFTQGTSYNLWINSIFIQATIQNISAEKYKNLQIPVPPIPEQKRIVSYISAITKKHNAIMERTQKEINLIQEYKTSLISSVVTGQIDVRNVFMSYTEKEVHI